MIAKEVHRQALFARRCAHRSGQPVSIREIRTWNAGAGQDPGGRKAESSILVWQCADGVAGGHAQALL